MVLFFITTFYISIAAMASLVYIKRWELITGHIFAAPYRPFVSRVSLRLLNIGILFPVMAWKIAQGGNLLLRYLARHTVAQSILWVEHLLESLLQNLRHGTRPDVETPSSFLHEVSEHKKALTRHAYRKKVKNDVQ